MSFELKSKFHLRVLLASLLLPRAFHIFPVDRPINTVRGPSRETYSAVQPRRATSKRRAHLHIHLKHIEDITR